MEGSARRSCASRKRRAFSAAAALVALGAFTAVNPAAALATTTVAVEGQILRVEASLSQRNDVDVSLVATQFQITENLDDMSASSGCTLLAGAREVRCATTGVVRFVIDVKAQNDKVNVLTDLPAQVSGGAGDDEILTVDRGDNVNGGLGNDRIITRGGRDFIDGDAGSDSISAGSENDDVKGGIGNDTINGNDGEDDIEGGAGDDTITAREESPTPFRDRVSCGIGSDRALVDLLDTVLSDCETVERSPVGQGPNVQIRTTRITGRGSGTVRIPLSCPREQAQGCTGTLELTAARGRPELGSRRFDLSPGERTTVRFNLRGKNRRQLESRRGIRLRATAREQDPQGRPKTTHTVFELRSRNR